MVYKNRILRSCRYYAVTGGILRYLAVFSGNLRYLGVSSGVWRYMAIVGTIDSRVPILATTGYIYLQSDK